ncbi:hypothetical protein FB451DRAFT_1495708 [Mycena latifolia]|nr:hypothetical protein FB451DRAFT_1495708 [Mycena latifolia]
MAGLHSLPVSPYPLHLHLSLIVTDSLVETGREITLETPLESFTVAFFPRPWEPSWHATGVLRCPLAQSAGRDGYVLLTTAVSIARTSSPSQDTSAAAPASSPLHDAQNDWTRELPDFSSAPSHVALTSSAYSLIASAGTFRSSLVAGPAASPFADRVFLRRRCVPRGTRSPCSLRPPLHPASRGQPLREALGPTASAPGFTLRAPHPCSTWAQARAMERIASTPPRGGGDSALAGGFPWRRCPHPTPFAEPDDAPPTRVPAPTPICAHATPRAPDPRVHELAPPLDELGVRGAALDAAAAADVRAHSESVRVWSSPPQEAAPARVGRRGSPTRPVDEEAEAEWRRAALSLLSAPRAARTPQALPIPTDVATPAAPSLLPAPPTRAAAGGARAEDKRPIRRRAFFER